MNIILYIIYPDISKIKPKLPPIIQLLYYLYKLDFPWPEHWRSWYLGVFWVSEGGSLQNVSQLPLMIIYWRFRMMIFSANEWIKSLVGWITKRQIASYHYCEWVARPGAGGCVDTAGSENRFLVTVIRGNSSGGAMPLQSHYRGHAGYYLVSYFQSLPQF